MKFLYTYDGQRGTMLGEDLGALERIWGTLSVFEGLGAYFQATSKMSYYVSISYVLHIFPTNYEGVFRIKRIMIISNVICKNIPTIKSYHDIIGLVKGSFHA